MRSASAAQLTSLVGSIALHACAVLVLLLAARKPSPVPVSALRERPDAWLGASAVEVDAVATPEATPNVANAASSESDSAPATAAASEDAAAPQPKPQLTPIERSPDAPPISKPKPKPIRPRTPTSAATGIAAVSAAADGNHEANTQAATGTFGSEGLPPGVRSLPSAFTRAIPPATGADPIWQSLPAGTQKPFTVVVEVDEQGHIASANILPARDGSEISLQFEHLRQRVSALLGGGLFALHNNAAAGREQFRITITLSDRAVKEESGPAELVERGFEPPRGNAAGRAYFTLASGRHFEARVEVLSARPK